MFLDNKYTKYYNAIIANAPKLPDHVYSENHHIIPVSLGGADDETNIINLSARTHYLCHLLLTKMVNGIAKKKMAYALSFFNTGCRNLSRTKPNSRWYEYSKRLLSEVRRGKPASAACLAAVSKAKKGVPISEEQKKKLSIALTKYKSFYAMSPNDDCYTGDDLREFCKSVNVSYNTIRGKKYPYVITAGKNRGWIFSDSPITDGAIIRSQLIEQASFNRSCGVKSQWTETRKNNNSLLSKENAKCVIRKANIREKCRFIVILKSPDNTIHTFESLSDVKLIGPVSTIQLCKIDKPIKTGVWAGWTKIKYEKANKE